jgi:hypothetical protein
MTQSSTSDASALAVAYYDDVEFALQLCDEMARLPVEDGGKCHFTSA